MRGALIRDQRVADIVLLIKRNVGHCCWQIWVLGNVLCRQTGVVITPLNSYKVSAIWVKKISKNLPEKFMVNTWV